MNGKSFFKNNKRGYALLGAIIALNIMAILCLTARGLWEAEIIRDLEAEYLFRAKQYKTAIELYVKKNNNVYPKNFEELYKKKFLRKLYKDPLSESGDWNVVMISNLAGKKNMMILAEELVPQYINRARIIGVCSKSIEQGYREYRQKKRYSEWAVYMGEQVDKEMPDFKYISQ